jgi:hypothetical protein
MLLYGLLMVGRRFPRSEAKEQGVRPRQMMGELGLLGCLVPAVLVGLWLSKDIFPITLPEQLPGWLGGFKLPGWLANLVLPGWLGWLAALALWLGFTMGTAHRPTERRPMMLSVGFFMLAFLLVLHALVGYVELGTDNWIIDITKNVVSDVKMSLGSLTVLLTAQDTALVAFIWTNVLMFILRFFAGPIVHKISPVGLLFCSAVVGTVGLILLGLPVVKTTWLWMGAVTVYGIGKTFYWPTMLGVISERFPRGGALALGFSGGVGMLSAGILGGPVIGYQQDYAATAQLKQESPGTYERYKSDKLDSPLPLLPGVAGLDNGKVGVLDDYMAIQEKAKQGELDKVEKKLQLEKDLELLAQQNRDSFELKRRLEWWQAEGQPNAEKDYPFIKEARLSGGKMALTWTAAVPAAMALGYLLLILYFRARGGYQAEVLTGHAAEDEKFTGGTPGPGEG